ncbi:hypothetical protein HGA91_06420 [candidate division WWE3 bacterium]|nr:hypothetical protein [candidate division WWE3 bacterium]
METRFTINRSQLITIIGLVFLIVIGLCAVFIQQGHLSVAGLTTEPTATIPPRTVSPLIGSITPAITVLPTKGLKSAPTPTPYVGTKITPKPTSKSKITPSASPAGPTVPSDNTSIDVILANESLNLGRLICGPSQQTAVNNKIKQLDSDISTSAKTYIACNNTAKTKGDACINACGTSISCLEGCGMTCESESKSCNDVYVSIAIPLISQFIQDVSGICYNSEDINPNKKPTLTITACYTDPYDKQ